MALLLLTLALLAAGVLLAAVSLAAVLGAVGVASGEAFERCERCHRIGLSAGYAHRAGCPAAAARLAPALAALRAGRLRGAGLALGTAQMGSASTRSAAPRREAAHG